MEGVVEQFTNISQFGLTLLFSVQVIVIPNGCLLCVLADDILNVSTGTFPYQHLVWNKNHVTVTVNLIREMVYCLCIQKLIPTNPHDAH